MKKYFMQTNYIKVLMQLVKSALKFFFIGYGWLAFLLRLSVVAISLTLNPFESAVHQFTTGAMKLWLLTCFFLIYSIIKLISDHTKQGKSIQTAMEQKNKEDEAKVQDSETSNNVN